MRAVKILCMAVAAGATAASATPASAPMPVVITSFKFSPSAFELRAGEPVILRLRNQAGSGHSFKAPGFFAAARLDPKSAAYVRDGEIEIPSHSEIDVSLTPAAGTYKFKCDHPFHAMLGMTGMITVR